MAIDLFSAAADARYNKIVRKYLARNAGYHNNGLAALNTAFLQSGVFLWIPKNVKLETAVAGHVCCRWRSEREFSESAGCR